VTTVYRGNVVNGNAV